MSLPPVLLSLREHKSGKITAALHDIQEELRPILLRRMKEDVENLPEKEEVVVWVQLTQQQRSYYKALYSNQVGTQLSLEVLLFVVCCSCQKHTLPLFLTGTSVFAS